MARGVHRNLMGAMAWQSLVLIALLPLAVAIPFTTTRESSVIPDVIPEFDIDDEAQAKMRADFEASLPTAEEAAKPHNITTRYVHSSRRITADGETEVELTVLDPNRHLSAAEEVAEETEGKAKRQDADFTSATTSLRSFCSVSVGCLMISGVT